MAAAVSVIAAMTISLLAPAAASAADTDPFTIVLVPDTQNYTYANRTAYLNGQMDWIVSSRASLNTQFVAHLGDLVSEYDNTTQWPIISNAMKKLDDAGIPNSVIPGNHDFNTTTRDVGPYDTHFPVTRYSQASWNSATVSYGGYLGQNQFGTDGADRKNMDSYTLLTAGGHDFLILNLEFEAPASALSWADRVLAAHPDRTVIMVTHSFLALDGSRRTSPQSTGGTAPSQMWSSFVATHCRIRMVLSGHEHLGDLGEARRTDNNACGQPVHQMLSDYQDRANGGNGWLRYLTFDPVAGTVAVKTYSTTLQQFETDASSQFTLPFALGSAPPANIAPTADIALLSTSGLTANLSGTASSDVDGTIASYAWKFGDGATGTGATASRTYAAPGTYTVELTVTDDDGAVDTETRPVTVSSTPPPTQNVVGSDAFARTVASGWGAADVGGAWTTPSGAAQLSVTNGVGLFTLSPSLTREARLNGLSGTSTITDVQVASDVAPSAGAASATVIGRLAANGDNYAARVRFEAGGILRLYLLRGETSLAGAGYIAPGSYAAGQVVNVRLSVRGTNPTTLAAKIWKVGAAEPANWQLQSTDSTTSLQSAGVVALRSSVSSSTTAPTVRLAYDNLSITTGEAPPANVPPVARFTSTTSGLTASVNGTTSTDTDGTIASYAWNFGTATAVGPTATHAFGSAGTYPVTLTVTDNAGATHAVTQNVTVTAPPPANVPPVARFTSTTNGLTVTVSGTTSTDTDGTIASYAWTFGTSGAATGSTASFSFPAAGTYPVTLTVTDNAGATHAVTQNVTVTSPPPANVPPVARFTSTTSGLTVTVNGTTSTDADGTIASYAWNFGTATAVGPSATHTFGSAGSYPVTLTVTDNAGATHAVTQNLVVTVAPPAGVLARDAFARTVAGGWGTADVGGAWTSVGNANGLSVSGGQGVMTLPRGDTRETRFDAFTSSSTVASIAFSSSVASAGGAASVTLIGREVGTSWYAARARLEPGGVMRMYLLRDETALGAFVLPGAYTAGQQLNVKVSVTGTNPTTVRGKIWLVGTSEPSAWQATGTDSSAAMQVAGKVAVRASISGSSTVATTVLRFDDLNASLP